ncbi:hypothetical protein CYMTET_16954, partial [Cymbomonas tetramitiformis]
MEMNKRGAELQKINLDVAHFDRRVTTEAMNSASPEYGEGKGVVQNAVMYPTDQSLRDHREIVISTPEKFNLSHAAQRALKASASDESMDDTVKAEVDNKTILAGIKESTLERRTCNGLEASKALVDGFAKIDLRVQEKAASGSRAKASLYKTSFTKQMENAKFHLANNCTEWPPSVGPMQIDTNEKSTLFPGFPKKQSKQGTSHVESVFASSNQILGWNTGLELAHCSILLHFVHYLLGKRRGNCKFIANFSADRIRGGYPETGHDAFYLEEEICAIFRSLGMAVPAGYERVISSPPTKLTFAVPLAYLRSAFRAFQFATPAQPAERMQLSVGPVHNELATVPMVTVSKSMTPPAATASQNPLMMMFQQHQTNQAPVLGGQPAFKRRQVTREEGHPIDPNTMAISATAVASSASTASAAMAGAAIACGGQQSIAAFAGSKKRPIEASASSNERKRLLFSLVIVCVSSSLLFFHFSLMPSSHKVKAKKADGMLSYIDRVRRTPIQTRAGLVSDPNHPQQSTLDLRIKQEDVEESPIDKHEAQIETNESSIAVQYDASGIGSHVAQVQAERAEDIDAAQTAEERISLGGDLPQPAPSTAQPSLKVTGGCPAGCSGNGVCNERLGRCSCYAGWNGLKCQDAEPRHCNVNPIKRSAALCDGVCDTTTGLCYCNGSHPERPLSMQCQTLETLPEKVRLIHEHRTPQAIFGPDGWCEAETTEVMVSQKKFPSGTYNWNVHQYVGDPLCTCIHDGYNVPSQFCMVRSKAFCPRDCTGNGKCNFGACECNPGYYDADCSDHAER